MPGTTLCIHCQELFEHGPTEENGLAGSQIRASDEVLPWLLELPTLPLRSRGQLAGATTIQDKRVKERTYVGPVELRP